jgi:hypothetical protein
MKRDVLLIVYCKLYINLHMFLIVFTYQIIKLNLTSEYQSEYKKEMSVILETIKELHIACPPLEKNG